MSSPKRFLTCDYITKLKCFLRRQSRIQTLLLPITFHTSWNRISQVRRFSIKGLSKFQVILLVIAVSSSVGMVVILSHSCVIKKALSELKQMEGRNHTKISNSSLLSCINSRLTSVSTCSYNDLELLPTSDRLECSKLNTTTSTANSTRKESCSNSHDTLYIAAADHAVRVLRERTSDNILGWIKWTDQGELSCYHGTAEDGRSIWRIEVIVNAPAKKVLLYLNESTNTPEWNHSVPLSKVIRQIDSMTEIVYTESVAIGPFQAREVISIKKTALLDGCHYIALTSINCDQHPVKEGKVRAGLGPSGFKIIPIGSNQAKVIWISDNDAKMPFWIPTSLLDFSYAHLIKQAAQCFCKKLANSVE